MSDEVDALLRRVQVLEAERDIAQLMATYSRLVDGGPDADAIAALFTPDAVYETFGYLGSERGADGPITGREAIRATFRALPEMLPFTAHFLCNPEIMVDADGSAGSGRWLTLELANAVHDDGRVPLVLVAQYHNDFVHHDDTWRIQRIRFGDLRAFRYDEGFATSRYVSMYDLRVVRD